MTPVEIGKGSSFKGLSNYLLDQKRPGEEAEQAQRVGWAQSYNLMDAAPDRAWRLMASTAISAPALKEAAGIRKGKATEKPVYHYSLNFNPGDKPSEDVQRAAVTSSLQALGLEGYQALAVAHHDKDHAHVHVMVNLIDPANGVSAASKQPDGRAAPLSMTQKKLSQWAMRFEREHGLTVTDGRIANQTARQNGEKVDATRVPRPVWEHQKAEGNDPRLAWQRRQQDDRRTMLGRDQAGMNDRHRAEWTALNESYQLEKATRRKAQPKFKQVIADIKEEMRPAWGDLFRRHRQQLAEFEKAERSTIGRLWHATTTALHVGKERGALTGLVAAFSKNERQAVVLQKHRQESAELGRFVREQITAMLDHRKRMDDLAARDGRNDYLARCTKLRAAHDEERTAMRAAWRGYNESRKVSAKRTRAPVQVRQPARGQSRDRGRGLEP